MNELERDYNYCHNIMKTHSKTFSYAFDFLDIRRKKQYGLFMQLAELLMIVSIDIKTLRNWMR